MYPRTIERRRGLAAALAAALALTLTPAGAARGAAEQLTARETMAGALDQVSELLLSEDLPKGDKRERVKALIERHVDFGVVSRLVLAQGWKKFSDPQKEEFTGLFQRHLLNTYWRNADYSFFAGFTITGDRKEQRRDWTVNSIVESKGSSEDIRIDYRMRQLGEEGDPSGEWKIIDILVEGVSLVANFRSQFQSIVSSGGPDKLLADLRAKVEEAERTAAADDAQ